MEEEEREKGYDGVGAMGDFSGELEMVWATLPKSLDLLCGSLQGNPENTPFTQY